MYNIIDWNEYLKNTPIIRYEPRFIDMCCYCSLDTGGGHEGCCPLKYDKFRAFAINRREDNARTD